MAVSSAGVAMRMVPLVECAGAGAARRRAPPPAWTLVNAFFYATVSC